MSAGAPAIDAVHNNSGSLPLLSTIIFSFSVSVPDRDREEDLGGRGEEDKLLVVVCSMIVSLCLVYYDTCTYLCGTSCACAAGV